MKNVKEMKITDYRRSVIEQKQDGPATRLRSACESKGKRGESRWPALCAALAMIGMVCTDSVEQGLDLHPVFSGITEKSNERAENYTFGTDRVFTHTVPDRASLKPDFKRVLEGCTPEDSLETFILHLHQFVEHEQQQVFRWAAREAFGIRIPVDMKVAC